MASSPASYPFSLDAFQQRAIAALDAGDSVLVAAPTGSGKTVVAEHAVDLALANGGKAFYTAPIKALSNQKFSDLGRRHGRSSVGLLTGDNSINPDAPVVVMTTEVLRNMVYARSPALAGLRFVILDEVHYLQDTYRGPVWEEVILHLPGDVRLVCLSATVSNAEELADWITTVRGKTSAVIEEHRPVDLVNLYCVGDRSSPELRLLPTFLDGAPNLEAGRLDSENLHAARWRDRGRQRFFTPRRVEVLERLRDEELLPAIYFIFSRAACDDAAAACMNAGLGLTTPAERTRIRDIAESHVEALGDEDLDVLGYDSWLSILESGTAAHHAGMIPPFKEAVEECFSSGLAKVVFATETLALGINMPARTVVIEKLSKFTGERHQFLTPGDYTQLTGRAGRRGLDPVGYAVVLWSPFVPFDQVASLASSRSFRLSSAFRPTYNMAVNLVRSYEPAAAHHLLNLSFAQYQADRSVVRMEARLEQRLARIEELERTARCERGDAAAYRAARDDLRALERRSSAPRAEVELALDRLRPGDVIEVDQGSRKGGPAAVLSFANRRDESRLRVLTVQRKVMTLGPADFDEPPDVIGQVELPKPFAPRNRAFQQTVARRLQHARLADPATRAERRGPSSQLGAAQRRVSEHPVDQCPERDDHLRALSELERARSDVEQTRRSVKGRSESLARRFDRVLRVLEAWGHLDGWSLTRKGELLGRIYHESDLLVAEATSGGLLDRLDPASLAGLVSCFTYERRAPGPPAQAWFPSSDLRRRFEQLVHLAADLNADEHEAGLPMTRPPQAEFVAIAHAWASGQALEEVLEDEEMTGGDFVRNVKQLIDLMSQIALAAESPATRSAARESADALFRGVVAASSVLQ